MLKNIIFISTVFGVYFFTMFVVVEKIPFPLEIEGLPSLLITVGLLGFLFSVVGSLYIFMAAIISYDPNEINYYDYFYKVSNLIKNKYLSSVVGFVIYFLIVPVTLWVCLLLEYSLYLPITWFFVIPLAYSFYLMTPNKSLRDCDFTLLLTSRYFILILTYYFVSLISNLSFFLYMGFLGFTGIVATDPEFYLSAMIFVILSYISLIPNKPLNEFELISKKFGNENLFSKFYKSPAAIICLFAIMFCLYPPVSAKITSRTLYILGLGGGVERVYYYTPESRVRLPNKIIDQCTENKYCETKPLRVILGVGGVLYVRLISDNNEPLIGLPSKNMYPIISEKDT